ncbi:MATE family multidrug resistance protein [Azonexus fungiphilus]|uniref:MATE family multidrug resistance protein n=1 Tax=Azonexus fungiphilus TaxID=146940 RepID=A0A495VLW8_9RHOO|nr:MATE family efflux transporter [Azonexus fungiphilus]RKT50344.1 MATE family multidrug resistance protein [Azonexus fungiphilus]
MLTVLRGLLAHAFPILVAQLASIGMMVVDTAVLGHVSPQDLAAVAIGGGIHVALVFALVGVVQAVAPVVAHLHGARRDDEVAGVLQQGFWLALTLSLPGVVFLLHPGFVLAPFGMDAVVDAKVREYLGLLAWSLPAALFYRTFYAFCNALGQPRVLMGIGLAALAVHALLAWGLALAGWAGAPLGVAGCALSNIVIGWLACLGAALWLHRGPLGRRYRPFANWARPHPATWRELLRLGLPMGFSNLVEITAFTLVALFVAGLGATVVAGHRIVANLSALAYMLPLSLAFATMAAVGQALGARDWPAASRLVRAGMGLAAVSSLVVGLLLWLAAEPLVAAYTDDPAVRGVALALIGYIAVYQFFDALQTIAGHVLRAYRVTFVPMLVQTVCFWGIALAGGAWLCYRWSPPLGVGGFWLASVIALVAAAAALLPLLRKVMKDLESTP